tara:strand:- start:5872 stop:7107 length:1236 start_codon:yes stop_codon:yes gene_type:complete
MKSAFLIEMHERGYVNQCTDLEKLDSIISKKSISAYIGFDCTASSLHVGSLLQIMILRLLQKHGHRPIVLLGGGTTLIGDPSGKDATRKILNEKEINKNIKGIKKVFEKLLDFKSKKTKPIFVDNFSWLGKLNYIDFLRKVGTQFTLNKMLTYDSVKLRLEREQSLSYMEFNYMILQAYDFFKLYEKQKCILQLGGSDQWGNIINGVELIRRILKKDAYGLTSPLITLSSGTKMGKTEKGAVWLNDKMFSYYDYWQFWRNTDDKDVVRFLNFFTDIGSKEIDELIKTEEINKLKIKLANETTRILHGNSKSIQAEKTAKDTFELGKINTNLPTTNISKDKVINGIKLLELLVDNKIMNSKSEVRRAILNNGIKVNGILVKNENKIINLPDFHEESMKISYGKKKHYLFKIT